MRGTDPKRPKRAIARAGSDDAGGASLALLGMLATLGALWVLGVALPGAIDAVCGAPGLHLACVAG